MKRKMKKIPHQKKKKIYKIHYLNIFLIFLIGYLLYYMGLKIYSIPIQNIIIQNNTYLTDQEIIELAGISTYPSTFQNSSYIIKKRLLDSSYILDCKVVKKNLVHVYIQVTENRPLFYNRSTEKIVYENGYEDNKNFVLPILVNYVPDTIYEKFIEKMALVEDSVLARISEIEYNPNEVDDKRFLLTMNDHNYVYLTLYQFENINSYEEVIKRFTDQKGILYLDSGEYFEVYEGNS